MHFGRSKKDPPIRPEEEAEAEAHMAEDFWRVKQPLRLVDPTPREQAQMILELRGPLQESRDEHAAALLAGNHREVPRLAADVHYWEALRESWRIELAEAGL